MATHVEILEVESIIRDLINCISITVFGARLVLDYKNNSIYYKQDIDTLAHSGNRKFKEYISVPKITKMLFQLRNLINPCILLRDIEREIMLMRKLTEDFIPAGN